MNRFSSKALKMAQRKTGYLPLAGKRFREETESMLRDMAFVLRITERLKKEILEQKENVTV